MQRVGVARVLLQDLPVDPLRLRQTAGLVVTDGYGKTAEVPGYYVGGKTGTAEKVSHHGYAKHTNVAAFNESFRKVNPGIGINSLSPNTGDALIITQAAAKPLGARALDANALLAALEETKNLPGLQGTWSFSHDSHEVSLKDGTALIKYDKGKWVAAP